MEIFGTLTSVDVSELKPRDWVRLICRDTRERDDAPAGIFVAGGEVVGTVHSPLVEYYLKQGVSVIVILDPILEGKAYFIRVSDIECTYRIKPLVPDD